MKLTVYWLVLFTMAFFMPSSFVTPCMVGSWLGIAWTLWYVDHI